MTIVCLTHDEDSCRHDWEARICTVPEGARENLMPGRMPLHEAIEQVLRTAGRPMHAEDVATEINRRELYARRDNEPVAAKQIRARVAKPEYRKAFRTNDGFVSLA